MGSGYDHSIALRERGALDLLSISLGSLLVGDESRTGLDREKTIEVVKKGKRLAIKGASVGPKEMLTNREKIFFHPGSNF